MTRASRTAGKKATVARGSPYAETALSTLIGTDELAAHLDDPAFVIVDVRHDLARPDTFGDAAYAVVALYLGLEMLSHLDGDSTHALALFDQASRLAALFTGSGSSSNLRETR